MRLPNAVQESHPWRIREIAPDFTLEDVWASTLATAWPQPEFKEKHMREVSTRAKAGIEVTGWEPEPFDEAETGPKLVRIGVRETFSGDIAGTGRPAMLQVLSADGRQASLPSSASMPKPGSITCWHENDVR